MTNDIIGAPELVIIKGKVYHFSPLNDYEIACLESWLRFHTDGKVDEVLSNEAVSIWSTVAGSTQLLYQSIHRNDTTATVLELAKTIDEVSASEICSAWIKLNCEGLPEKVTSSKVVDKSTSGKAAKSDIYILLARNYAWASPEVVSRMTSVQQWEYIKPIIGESDRLTFSTQAEFQEWQSKNPKS